VRSRLRPLASSLGLALHRLRRRGGTLRILYYHSISSDPVRSRVAPPDFVRHMEHLSRSGFHLLPLAEGLARLASPEPLPPRSLAVTLDDGFRDNYEHAFPALLRFGIPATIFLTAGYIGTDRLPTLTRTDFVPRPLSWEQVKEMHAHGIAFGSHTMTHPNLTEVPLAEARREIVDSKRLIEDRLGAPVPLFCYPRGDLNAAVCQAVREAGYTAACSTLPGLNHRGTDPFLLRRTYVSRQDSAPEFAKKADGGYDLLQEAGRRWHALRKASAPGAAALVAAVLGAGAGRLWGAGG
jgi:peptidoglycan/xylan/chitin deacetylase (PgdA/CDA1 family)